MMRAPLVTAHTGCDGSPANSIESVLTGAGLGADVNEVDVRVSADGVLVLHHDEFLKTRAEEITPIKYLMYSDIRRMEAKREIGRLTRLDDVFDAVKNRDIALNLDLKDDECVIPAAALVRAHKLGERVVFSGCGYDRACSLKRAYPDFHVLLNADEDMLGGGESPVERYRILCGLAQSAGCRGLNIPHRYCEGELVEYAASAGLPVDVWTVNPEDDFERFIGMGVASITTLYVRELLYYLRDVVESGG